MIITTKLRAIIALMILVVFLGLTSYISKPSPNAPLHSKRVKLNFKEASTDSSTKNVYNSDGHKIAYLTFDDGPSSKTTPQILKILDSYNIKATFFIVGNRAVVDPNLVKMEASSGQSIGNHTYSHEYNQIYSNTGAFIRDVNKCDAVLKSIIGSDYNSKILRFPGGSFGSAMSPFRKAIKDYGYHYIDWNDLTGDAEGHNITVTKLLNNIKKYSEGKEHVVILMHDAPDKETTVQALPQVIEYLKSQEYSFNTLK
ncbi:polysaccharide deacetylase [Clostridium algoriphilum]|uniref:polysaccharide deacetylase family protein n=1 Tax=Clostridium algoriphilum TaxID=198347 RepID=UPI001CF0DA5E|nr:polysaccharide deacetylase family protein [Clostridium algoriphilum]MCB2293376.1 polysaccharide deacetylase [Clostridium algoriphilum]